MLLQSRTKVCMIAHTLNLRIYSFTKSYIQIRGKPQDDVMLQILLDYFQKN